MHLIDTSAGFPVYVINLYAWPGALEKARAMEQTVAMLDSTFAELQALGFPPFVIMGDLNAPPGAVMPVALRLGAGELFDPASVPALTGQEAPLATCLAHTAREFSRRDVILLHPKLR
eukprot:13126644-Alexandrium_andersonii.AAC.1